MEPSKQIKYILGITLVVTSVFFLFLLIRSNEIMEDMKEEVKNPTKVLILTTDNLRDQSWGSQAYKGKLEMENEFNVDINLKAEVDIDNELESFITEAIENDVNLIIGHGREFSEAFYKLSDYYKDIQFITIHGTYVNDNLAVYTFDHQEIEYVAGVAAALKTKTKKVGVIDAVDNRHKDWGFPKGLATIDPTIEFQYGVVYSREDHEKALEIANNMIEDGVDIIYSKGNSYNQSVINLAKEKGLYTIGYLEDQAYMANEIVLTSVLNNVPKIYTAIMKDYTSENGIEEEIKYLDTTDGVYGLAPFGDMFTQEELDIISKEKEEILALP
ncbi:BMP family ABC transporter substrate-binding protein [Gracilibacillus marinus]|jgi:transcriptional activator of comK gene|uniref:BMP family ABC transporter substrate-binding protein n=1 Tax=Gracilibacillus marinus TaxID=630535 RepID=A0ABV8VVP4_9BACI